MSTCLHPNAESDTYEWYCDDCGDYESYEAETFDEFYANEYSRIDDEEF